MIKLFKVTVDGQYTGCGTTYLAAIKNLPTELLTAVYSRADQMVCQLPAFAEAVFPLSGSESIRYNAEIEAHLEAAFDYALEINNHKIKWSED